MFSIKTRRVSSPRKRNQYIPSKQSIDSVISSFPPHLLMRMDITFLSLKGIFCGSSLWVIFPFLMRSPNAPPPYAFLEPTKVEECGHVRMINQVRSRPDLLSPFLSLWETERMSSPSWNGGKSLVYECFIGETPTVPLRPTGGGSSVQPNEPKKEETVVNPILLPYSSFLSPTPIPFQADDSSLRIYSPLHFEYCFSTGFLHDSFLRTEKQISYQDYCEMEHRLSDILRAWAMDSRTHVRYIVIFDSPHWLHDESLVSYRTVEERHQIHRFQIVDVGGDALHGSRLQSAFKEDPIIPFFFLGDTPPSLL